MEWWETIPYIAFVYVFIQPINYQIIIALMIFYLFMWATNEMSKVKKECIAKHSF